jgi:hypothetical protein
MKLKFLKDKSKYFKKVDGSIIFKGKKLKIYVPKNYADQKLFSIDNTVHTLGVLRYEIDNTYYSNMILLLMLEIDPSEINSINIENNAYYELVLYKNDRFLCNTNIIKNNDLLYQMFVSFLALGKIPTFLPYDKVSSLFDNAKEHCGISLGVNRVIFEMIYSHVYRDKADPKKFYRHTPMKELPLIIALHMISYSPTSNLAKLMGSYMKEGLISSLDDVQNTTNEIENLFRV